MNKFVAAVVGAVSLTALYLAFDFVVASGDESRPGMRVYRALAKRGLVPSLKPETDKATA